MKTVASLFLLGVGLALAALSSKLPREISFESLESKTETGGAVYNQVSFSSSGANDVWWMKQNHHSLTLETKSDFKSWDSLAIVVDKQLRQATFYELASGRENLSEMIPLKARCMACHANGPRALRPNFESKVLVLDWAQKIKIALWNLRIKSYGSLQSRPARVDTEGAPFRSKLQVLARAVPFESCKLCHVSGGLRNELTYEQFGSIEFLVKNKMMPPFPFSLTQKDRELLGQKN